MSYLKNIARLSRKDNLGGLVDLRVCRKSDIASLPDAVNGAVYGNIVLKPGAIGFVNWQATMETPNMQSRGQRSREGESKRNQLRLSIPVDNPEVRQQLELATGDEFILLFTDSLGKQKIGGTLDAPFLFTFDHDSGSRMADGSFYNASFFYDGPDNIFFYNGTDPAPPATVGSAVVYFNDAPIAVLTAGQELRIYSEFGFTNFFTTTP
ncbi:MAG: hypothetical protein O9302_00300 [Cyclobacteriaceae bacterium]|nr:hypothetical protein [Cytophagales bacterium]MCZ8326471.1 hypothetical protein [Cyclobacteriaceae bacterium]